MFNLRRADDRGMANLDSSTELLLFDLA